MEKRYPKIKIILKSFSPELIYRFYDTIEGILRKTGANAKGLIPLPTSKRLFSVLRSPFIYKKHYDQYHCIRYKFAVFIYQCSQETIKELANIELVNAVEVQLEGVKNDAR